MKKAIVSFVLCGLAMRLALMAGAENVFAGIAETYVPAESEYEQAELPASEEIKETEVGNIITVPVEILDESGETAQISGEVPSEEVVETTIRSDLSIRNDTSYDIDLAAFAEQMPRLSLSAEGPQVLIIHTHGSEAYTSTGKDSYFASDPYRTEDKSKNVVKVGDVLAEILESKGIGVIHDREIYDFPSYTGSYSRSGAAVEKYLTEYPGIGLVIDLHRDALGSGDTVYKTRAETAGGECAQVMLLVGTGENGLYHPDWRQNLLMGLYLQSAMEERYPTLARPLALKSERYNQHLCPGSLILEVGSTGNTLSEAVAAIELFGEAAGEALLKLINNE